MRLNQETTPDVGPGGKKPELAVTPTVKAAVAKHIQDSLLPDIAEKGRIADMASEAVAGSASLDAALSPTSLPFTHTGSLRDWDTGRGLQYGLTQWDKQVRGLQERVNATMVALGYTGRAFSGNEADAEGRFNRHAPPRLPLDPGSSPLPRDSGLNGL